MESIQQYISDILPQLGSIIGQFLSQAAGMVSYAFSWLHDNPVSAGAVYTQVIRWVMPLLALHILISVLREMLRVRNPLFKRPRQISYKPLGMHGRSRPPLRYNSKIRNYI